MLQWHWALYTHDSSQWTIQGDNSSNTRALIFETLKYQHTYACVYLLG